MDYIFSHFRAWESPGPTPQDQPTDPRTTGQRQAPRPAARPRSKGHHRRATGGPQTWAPRASGIGWDRRQSFLWTLLLLVWKSWAAKCSWIQPNIWPKIFFTCVTCLTYPKSGNWLCHNFINLPMFFYILNMMLVWTYIFNIDPNCSTGLHLDHKKCWFWLRCFFILFVQVPKNSFWKHI